MGRAVEIRIAKTDADITACYDVMAQLRPHVPRADFLPRVRRMMKTDGYRLAFVEADGIVQAVAGYRVQEMLYRGRFLYVDDLVTDADARSKGFGGALLRWLHEEARRQDCERIDLDTGVQRVDAHRFYEREGMKFVARHYETLFAARLGAERPVLTPSKR